MATDIAFSLGILSLLGKRVPLSLKIFLTAFAIVDDLGAVFVIAIFYSGQIYWNMLFIGLGFFAVLGLMIFFGLRSRWVFIIAGGIIWYYFLKSGVHPTISGVMLAMIVPAGRRIRVPAFSRLMRKNLDAFCDDECEDQLILTKSQLRALDDIEEYVRHVQSPLQTLEHRMHGFVSYIIMPVFALANAGIILSAGEGPGLFGSLTFDIALALLLGKLFGILGFSWLGVKFKLGALPEGIRWVHITGLALLGGIGFTMSLFIASMAYLDPIILNQAKIGIILGSMVAGIGGYLLLRYTLKYNL